ncbi:MAG TPA: hypothetical protein VK735_08860 [Pseudonocardia sp.]|uniref:hypothetical protein n=1 Tax=Pseudonocardia sp. TaxID=60912 RepID=UPI002CF4C32B|nr:hypothetical protein [Pseudonocardia sp.]HTF47543.1 hypothetical protein [Pseudonocardia sp.]
MKLAFTGHRGLPEATERLVDADIRAALAERGGGKDELVGHSCIADGADALFAQAILDAGGSLVVVVPAAKYRDGLPESYHPTYDALLSRAEQVIQLDHTESTSASHMHASLRMIEDADELLAVWDGQPARGYGGTADVVHAANERGIPVTVIWPPGAERD